jgi:DHA2 family multidrug resistance protein
VFRVLQGLGGGGLAPSEQSILADSFPQEKRAQAFALYGVAVVVAPTLGPTLGGFITDSFSWRWIFLINVPVCLLSLFLSGMFITDPPAVQKDRDDALKGGIKIDFLGFILVAVGLACLQVVLDKGTEDDWFASDFILIFAVTSVISLVAMVLWELNHDDPIVDLSLMRNWNFSASMIVMFVTGLILISTTQMLPQYLQTVMGYTATKAGLALTAGGCATLIMMPVSGALLRKVQPRYLIAFGLLVESLACLFLRGFNTDINFGHAALGRMFQGAGLPFLFVPITTISYVGIPAGKSNSASALINTMRNLGGSFGISIAVGLLAYRGQFHHARLSESVTPFTRARFNSHDTLAVIGGIVERQAEMWSYIDVFMFLAILAACAIPITFLLREVKPGEGNAAA